MHRGVYRKGQAALFQADFCALPSRKSAVNFFLLSRSRRTGDKKKRGIKRNFTTITSLPGHR